MLTRRSFWPVLLASCVRAPPPPPRPPPPPPPPSIVVPEGCLADLSGALRHHADARYQYEATDDGGALLLSVFLLPEEDAGRSPRRFSRDGGLKWLLPPREAGVDGVAAPRDAGSAPLARLLLHRTPSGFVGTTLTGDGGGCPFPTRVTACEPAALTLETVAWLSADCAVPGDAGVRPHRLLRVGFDAGAQAPPSDTPRHDAAFDGGPDGGAEASPGVQPAPDR